MTRVLFDVPINDDNILERDETIIIIIDLSSLSNRIILDSSGQARVTIIDDDCKHYYS